MEAPALPSLRFRNLTEIVADSLRQAILGGALKPGQRLMDAAIAAQMGTSRTPVREALRQLEKEGLVASVPNKGSIVRELSEQDVVQLFAIRGVLEGMAAAWACQHISDAEIKTLRNLCGVMRSMLPALTDEDRARLQGPIVEFHRLMVSCARSPLLEEMLEGIWMRIRLVMATANRSPRVGELVAEHEALVDALERRDPQAAEAAARHITERAIDRALPVLADDAAAEPGAS